MIKLVKVESASMPQSRIKYLENASQNEFMKIGHVMNFSEKEHHKEQRGIH